MSAISIIDTSVFLNLLDVPNRNGEREQVYQAFSEYVELGATFILPMATIIETGNHIARTEMVEPGEQLHNAFVNK